MKKINGIIVITLAFFSCSKTSDTISPQRKNIIEAVYASGTIHPLNEYKVFANATGILRNVFLHEGDSVLPEQLLFEVESRDPELRIQSALDALDYARQNASENSATVEELRSNVESARAKYAGDSLLLGRTKELLSLGSTTRAEFDRVTSLFESSRALFIAAEHRLTGTRRSLENQRKLAEKQLLLAQSSKGNFQVRSRTDGIVYALYKEEGEMVTNQQPVALVGDSKQYTLRLVIDASDVVRVKPGQKVLYSIDAFPDSTFSATVTKTFPVLENETQSFRVDAMCDAKPPVPFIGTQVQANIVISQKENALVIPRAFLQVNNQVYVKEGVSTKTQNVSVGISNLEYVEMLSGVDEKSVLLRKK